MNIAIIFAGGSGVRMGAGVPKQFLEINGKPILFHTLSLFEEHHEIDKIYLAVLKITFHMSGHWQRSFILIN